MGPPGSLGKRGNTGLHMHTHQQPSLKDRPRQELEDAAQTSVPTPSLSAHFQTQEVFLGKNKRKQNVPTLSAIQAHSGIWQTCKSSSRQELGVLLYRRNLDTILPRTLGLFLPSDQTLQPGPSRKVPRKSTLLYPATLGLIKPLNGTHLLKG